MRGVPFPLLFTTHPVTRCALRLKPQAKTSNTLTLGSQRPAGGRKSEPRGGGGAPSKRSRGDAGLSREDRKLQQYLALIEKYRTPSPLRLLSTRPHAIPSQTNERTNKRTNEQTNKRTTGWRPQKSAGTSGRPKARALAALGAPQGAPQAAMAADPLGR